MHQLLCSSSHCRDVPSERSRNGESGEQSNRNSWRTAVSAAALFLLLHRVSVRVRRRQPARSSRLFSAVPWEGGRI